MTDIDRAQDVVQDPGAQTHLDRCLLQRGSAGRVSLALAERRAFH